MSVCAMSVPAQALTFTLNNVGGAGSGTQARAGFDAAAYFWSQLFTDNVNVKLDIAFKPLEAGVLGSTKSSFAAATVADVYASLFFDQTTIIDVAAVGNLPALTPVVGGTYNGSDQLGMIVNRASSVAPASTGNRQTYSDQGTRFDLDGSANNVFLGPTTANLKALDFVGPALSGTDGSVAFNTGFGFDFDPRNGITSGKYDFVAVAIHEIGHALGFISGVDFYDGLTVNASPAANPNAPGFLDDYAVGGVIDLFRYNANGDLDWSTSGANKFFSLDGSTPIPGGSNFSLGQLNGDGRQASHWQAPPGAACAPFEGLMNPYLCPGQLGIVTGLDLVSMDAIGWDLNFSKASSLGFTTTTSAIFASFVASIPEPATWAQMVAGFALLGGAMRRTRRRVAFARA